MELTEQQAFVVRNLYLAAFVPLVVTIALYHFGRLPRWVMAVYAYSFLLCALGWEVWYTFGLVGGLPVDARRAPAMSEAIPQNLNWVLTSLFDAAICLIGLFLIWLIYGFRDTAFKAWKWPALMVLSIVFVGQNIYVEYMIHDQVKPGLPLSWAPLIPTGPWFNFVLFEIGGRAITFQTQLPWVLMVPVFSWLVFWCHGRYGPGAGRR
ncbi:MAG: hypothetical protein GY723_04045 [bacterium]|nr:hypothetical protein [bacterium]MCP5070227.1 hypothetical protein [bacterium]